jgi:hypothetical protein
MEAAMTRNFIAIVKPSGERYLFFYDDRKALLKTLIRFAADRSLSFTTADAAAVALQASFMVRTSAR